MFTINAEEKHNLHVLKKAMSTFEKNIKFQPRGPSLFEDEGWRYSCKFTGNISDFKGDEKIEFKNEVVFTHDFYSGVIDWRKEIYIKPAIK